MLQRNRANCVNRRCACLLQMELLLRTQLKTQFLRLSQDTASCPWRQIRRVDCAHRQGAYLLQIVLPLANSQRAQRALQPNRVAKRFAQNACANCILYTRQGRLCKQNPYLLQMVLPVANSQGACSLQPDQVTKPFTQKFCVNCVLHKMQGRLCRESAYLLQMVQPLAKSQRARALSPCLASIAAHVCKDRQAGYCKAWHGTFQSLPFDMILLVLNDSHAFKKCMYRQCLQTAPGMLQMQDAAAISFPCLASTAPHVCNDRQTCCCRRWCGDNT